MKKQRRGRRQIKNCSAKKKRREKKKVARNLVKLEEAISKGKEASNNQRNKEKANGKTKYRPYRLTEGSSQQGKAGGQNESRFQDERRCKEETLNGEEKKCRTHLKQCRGLGI